MAKEAILPLWCSILEQFERLAERYDGYWQERSRCLDSRLLMEMIFKVVISQNRQGLQTSIDDFWQKGLCLGHHVPQAHPVAASSFSMARQKLDEQCFKDFNTCIVSALEAWAATVDRARYRWLGHRTFAIDGSSLNLPPRLVKSGFRLPTPTSHYPQAMLSCLFNLRTQLPVDAYLTRDKNEGRLARKHLTALSPGDVVVFDRAYLSFSLVQEQVSQELHGVWRLKTAGTYREIVTFWSSVETDKIVELKPQSAKNGATPIQLRLVKYVIEGKAYCLATTLICAETYSVEALKALYHERWGIEELYKISKNHLEIEQFHALSPRGIRQEVYAHIALISLTRVLTNAAEIDLNPDVVAVSKAEYAVSTVPKPRKSQASAIKVNFKHALHIMRLNLEALLSPVSLARYLRCVIKSTLSLIARNRTQIRPNRRYARISRKPIHRWQKNIHKEWRKRRKAHRISCTA